MKRYFWALAPAIAAFLYGSAALSQPSPAAGTQPQAAPPTFVLPPEVSQEDAARINQIINREFSIGGGFSTPLGGGSGGIVIRSTPAPTGTGTNRDAPTGAVQNLDISRFMGRSADTIRANFFCEAACDIAAAAAAASCSGITAGAGAAACFAAAAAGQQYCKSRC